MLNCGKITFTFRDSSTVEHSPVKRMVLGSNPSRGAKLASKNLSEVYVRGFGFNPSNARQKVDLSRVGPMT